MLYIDFLSTRSDCFEHGRPRNHILRYQDPRLRAGLVDSLLQACTSLDHRGPPSSAPICSTGGASSSEYSGSERASGLASTACLPTRSLPSHPVFTLCIWLVFGESVRGCGGEGSSAEAPFVADICRSDYTEWCSFYMSLSSTKVSFKHISIPTLAK